MRTVQILLLAAIAPWAMAFELDESPAEPGDWGYRPADGAVVDVSPPGFTWRPTSGAEAYELEAASDANFQDVVYSAQDQPWNAHGATKAFAPGGYYWRYRARNADGEWSNWSTVRAFEVPPDAPTFPKLTPAEAKARMPRAHPRLFFRPEQIEQLRSLAAGGLASEWEALVQTADRLLESPPDSTEPPLYPEGTVRLSDEWRQIWWGNRRHAIAVADSAALLGFVYRVSGEIKYGMAARDLLMAIAEWDVDGSTNYQYNDEAAMPLLYMPARAYSWAYPALSEADRAALAGMMRARGQQCYDHLLGRNHLWRPYASHSNRAWHKLAEAAIAFYDDIPEAPQWLELAKTIFYTCYPVWGDAEGGWHEGAAYWNSYLGRFMHWAGTARAAFSIDVFDRPFFRQTGYYGMYLLPPGSAYGGFSDQAPPMTSSRIANLMAQLAVGAQNPHWQWYAEQAGGSLGGGYLGFLWAARAGRLEAEAPEDLPASMLFPGVGLAVLNSNLLDGTENVQVHFKSSPMGRQSHGYNANNAFLLTLKGQGVFIRSGRRDVHGSEHHREYMWHSKSDNAILVDGQSQRKHSPDATGRITAFQTTSTVDVVAGETSDAESRLERWVRRIIFFKPDAVLIHDVIDLEEALPIDWLLHAQDNPFELGENQLGWAGDPGQVSVQFLEPTDLRFSQTDKFEPPYAEWTTWELNEWHLTARTAAAAPYHDFVTLIAIDGASVTAELTETGERERRATVRLPSGETATVTLAPDHFAVDAPGLQQRFQD